MSKEPEEHIEVSMTLENKFQEFMEELQQDMHESLGPDVPFTIKMDFELGTDKSHEDKLLKYREKLNWLMTRGPKEFTPRKKPVEKKEVTQ